MKKKKSEKLNIVKCKDLRVYKDSMRPAVFKDKRKSEKYQTKEIRNYEEEE